MRLLTVLIVLVLLIAAGLAGYAYLGDMQPVRSEVRSPVGAPPATDRAPAAATP